MRWVPAQRFYARGGRLRLAAMLVLSLAPASCGPRELPSPAAIPAAADTASAPQAKPPPRSDALPADVRRLVDKMAEDFPDEAESYLARGRVLYLYSQSDEALWCWEASLNRDPNFALAHEAIGHLRLLGGEFDLAADHFRRATELDPSLDEVRLHWAEALSQIGRHREAIPILAEQLRRQPGSSEAAIGLGQAYLETEQYDLARTTFEWVLERNGKSRAAWFGLARACDRLGQSDRAEECRQRYRSLEDALDTADRQRRQAPNPGQDSDSQRLAQALCVTADLYALYGRTAEAQDHWRQAASLDKNNLAARQGLGKSLAREGRLAEAEQLYEELCELAPARLDFLVSQGVLEQQQGKFEEAEQAYLRVGESDPSFPQAPAALVKLYLATGKKLPEARRQAMRLVQLQPTAENFFLLSTACRANQELGEAGAAIKEAIRLDPKNQKYASAASELFRE